MRAVQREFQDLLLLFLPTFRALLLSLQLIAQNVHVQSSVYDRHVIILRITQLVFPVNVTSRHGFHSII